MECSEPGTEAADVESCQEVLDEMSTTALPVSFGHRGDPDINVALPLGLETGKIPFMYLSLSYLIRHTRADETTSGS